MREWGSKAVWNFSENSSFLALSPIPNQCFFCLGLERQEHIYSET